MKTIQKIINECKDKLKKHNNNVMKNIITDFNNPNEGFNVKKINQSGNPNLDKNFNWRIDKLAFTVELEILYWALLGSSQFVDV